VSVDQVELIVDNPNAVRADEVTDVGPCVQIATIAVEDDYWPVATVKDVDTV
jgi:hypothetical protein